jgi:hypothetical protein
MTSIDRRQFLKAAAAAICGPAAVRAAVRSVPVEPDFPTVDLVFHQLPTVPHIGVSCEAIGYLTAYNQMLDALVSQTGIPSRLLQVPLRCDPVIPVPTN